MSRNMRNTLAFLAGVAVIPVLVILLLGAY